MKNNKIRKATRFYPHIEGGGRKEEEEEEEGESGEGAERRGRPNPTNIPASYFVDITN